MAIKLFGNSLTHLSVKFQKKLKSGRSGIFDPKKPFNDYWKLFELVEVDKQNLMLLLE